MIVVVAFVAFVAFLPDNADAIVGDCVHAWVWTRVYSGSATTDLIYLGCNASRRDGTPLDLPRCVTPKRFPCRDNIDASPPPSLSDHRCDSSTWYGTIPHQRARGSFLCCMCQPATTAHRCQHGAQPMPPPAVVSTAEHVLQICA